MMDMGLDFKAPVKSNAEAWQVLRVLAANGVTFHGCGCFVGFKPPRKLRDVPEWLERHLQKSESERLLSRFESRTTT